MSLTDDLNGLRTLMVTNLTDKGATADNTMGLTTLANKIPTISGGGGGTLYTYSTLTFSTANIFKDETIVIQSTITDSDNNPVPNLQCCIKEDSNILVDNISVSDEDGKIILYYTPTTSGSHNISIYLADTEISTPTNITVKNPNYFVSATGSDSNDGTSSTTPFLTLNKALNTASADDGIFIGAGSYKGTDNCALTITKNLTIYSSERVFFNGESSIKSGFIINNGISIVLSGLYFINGANTGALDINSNSCIVNCSFDTNNRSTTYSSSSLNTCTGGAIYYSGSNNQIFNSIFNTNGASYGGAVYFQYGDNNIIKDCTFIKNTATRAGACCFYTGTYNTISNCIFNKNSATYGGAFWFIYGNNNIIQECDFKDNTSSNNVGSGIYFSSSANYNTITNCNFNGNSESVIYTCTASYNSITNCNFNYNLGTGIFCEKSNYNTISNCNFIGHVSYCINNKSSSYNTILDCSFTGNMSSVIFINTGCNTITISNCNFIGNNSGGGFGGGVASFDSKDIYIYDCIFMQNNSNRNGGAIYFYAPSVASKLYINNCIFKNNTKTGNPLNNIYMSGSYSTGLIKKCYWNMDSPTDSTYGTLIGTSVEKDAQSNQIYNIIKADKTSVTSGTKVKLQLIGRTVNDAIPNNMTLNLKNNTTGDVIKTFTTKQNKPIEYTLTVTESIDLILTGSLSGYWCANSSVKTITVI